MNAIIILTIGLSFIGAILLSSKIAELRCKTYKGNEPLYFIYGMILIVIWASAMVYIMENVFNIKL